MEFTVSKTDLVRELNLSQGVVEKKTTIPILSNVLVEAMDGRIQFDVDRSRTGCSCFLSRACEKDGCGYHSREETSRLCPSAARR